MSLCKLCPRQCNIDRERGLGYCRETDTLRVARIAPHFFEEPPISSVRGSGTVFFCGCSLRCVFCQNRDISRGGDVGEELSEDELYSRIVALLESGVHNLNLVTPTHFSHRIAPLLEKLKASGDLRVPVVYNTSGYERVETLRRLDGLVDIYLPDFKYFSSELSARYSSAPDYKDVATAALAEMLSQRGRYRYSEDSELLESGVVVRHLVLPSHRKDSISVLRYIAATFGTDDLLLSLMSQYTPEFALDTPYKNLHRKVTSFEYDSVCKEAERLGFDGFFQSRSSASASYTPDFKQES